MLVVRTEALRDLIRSTLEPDVTLGPSAQGVHRNRMPRAKAMHPSDVKEDWVALARRYALQVIDAWATDTRPSVSELARRVEKRFKSEGVVGARGNALSSESIRARALRGSEWSNVG